MSSAIRDKKQQPLVRIDSADKAVLDQLSEKTGESTPRLLHKAVTSLKKQIFFEQMNGAYRDISNDPKLLAIEMEERNLFEQAIADGL